MKLLCSLSLSLPANSSSSEQHLSVTQCSFFSLLAAFDSASEWFSNLFTRMLAACPAEIPGEQSGRGHPRLAAR